MTFPSRFLLCGLIPLATLRTVQAQGPSAPVMLEVRPATATVTLGEGQQFTATMQNGGGSGVRWTVSAPSGSLLSPGTISEDGRYQTPFPAPPSVTVTATSVTDPAVHASAVVTLQAPAVSSGPLLRVDTGTPSHSISPLIYGMNAYSMSPDLQSTVHVPVDRWGGDGVTRWNWKEDILNAANDWYFENDVNANTRYPDRSMFNTQFEHDRQFGSLTLATVPLIGWTTKRAAGCGFSVAKYGAQAEVDPHHPDCGKGMRPGGKPITGNDPADTSMPIDQRWVGAWVKYLVGRYGAASTGGVKIYALDNEPEYWASTHRDVHPEPVTYDELTGKGIAYARAIKAADPSAEVSGPVISDFYGYFYSWKDVMSGWRTGACHCQAGNPVDRKAHGDVPLLAYYLQKMNAASAADGRRLLDYLDLHTYFAPKGADLDAPAGDTAMQAARLNATRVFWDPTYTDPRYRDPNVKSRMAPAVPLEIVPMMRRLVAANYPGTKTAITEYNWGGQESLNGAVAQADILGIFGREGLDMATLWGPPDPVKQR
ncbi:MAG TPA: glycoside hydrolase family 44 protein, partial [Acidobacteriaceae bacterium]|nr:glycoside hydrolase family 44 protein [Acidobacteriaceae bacterium]